MEGEASLSQINKCAICKTDLIEGTSYCPSCGQSIYSKVTTENSNDIYECTACGEDVEQSAKFCPHCGEKFDGFVTNNSVRRKPINKAIKHKNVKNQEKIPGDTFHIGWSIYWRLTGLSILCAAPLGLFDMTSRVVALVTIILWLFIYIWIAGLVTNKVLLKKSLRPIDEFVLGWSTIWLPFFAQALLSLLLLILLNDVQPINVALTVYSVLMIIMMPITIYILGVSSQRAVKLSKIRVNIKNVHLKSSIYAMLPAA